MIVTLVAILILVILLIGIFINEEDDHEKWEDSDEV